MHKYVSPAKLNLFLRIVGRKTDGYHLLQSIFTKINLYDELEFILRNDGIISREINVEGIEFQQDLSIKAAKIMQSFCTNEENRNNGIHIKVQKNIPMGAGLGGGSSNAAIVLCALNKLWNINLSNAQLAEIGLKLGADIPFFIQESNSAWVEGIGEYIKPISLNEYYFIVVKPNVHASTKDIFTNKLLVRDNPEINQNEFYFNIKNIFEAGNTLEPVVLDIFPQIKTWLNEQYQASNIKFRMTGSGSCFFSIFENKLDRDKAINNIVLPTDWMKFSCNNTTTII